MPELSNVVPLYSLARKDPLDDHLKTDCTSQMKEDFIVTAGAMGYTQGELMRIVIGNYLYGSVEVIRSHARERFASPNNVRG